MSVDRDERIRIARRAAAGDPAAIAELVTECSPTVWRICAALVDRASADDLCQETFVRAIGSLAGYGGEADPAHWLAVIARRACADEIRGRQRRRALHDKLRLERPLVAGDPTVGVDLTSALAALTPERREAFVLTTVAGLSYAEAAVACDCPIGTIRSRVARARADLVGWLADEPSPPEPALALAG